MRKNRRSKKLYKTEWYRERHYLHFDPHIGEEEALAIVTDQSVVAKHAFWPFIKSTLSNPRYKPEKHKNEIKERPIAYSAHLDSQILAYYAYILRTPYEDEICNRGITDSVLAYRKFSESRRCNIHFAKEAFEHIQRIGECKVIALDVEDFFGSIDHSLLKKHWSRLLNLPILPRDHYSIFKTITSYAFIERADLYKLFNVSRSRAHNWREPICTPEEFRQHVRPNGIIQKNQTGKGIPQGSPISAFLSNLYMIDLDTVMTVVASLLGAVYRRYSDDILLICPKNTADIVIKILHDELDHLKLSLSPKKTKDTVFQITDGLLHTDKTVQYLGFEFDGQQITIRSTTIAKYVGRMRRAVSSAARAAKKSCIAGGDPRIYKRYILRRYSGLDHAPSYPKYVKRAAGIMGGTAIKRQHKKHWNILNKFFAKPVCRKECDACKGGAISTLENQLGHGTIITRDYYCPHFHKKP